MSLNSASVIPVLTTVYSGIALYFPKAACQSASLNGGMAPRIGCHSVIESPESVSRVAPPTTTIAKTSAATITSQARTAGSAGRPICGGACRRVTEMAMVTGLRKFLGA
jgi:hypothetical protein